MTNRSNTVQRLAIASALATGLLASGAAASAQATAPSAAAPSAAPASPNAKPVTQNQTARPHEDVSGASSAMPATAKTADESAETGSAKSEREAKLDQESADSRRIVFRYQGTSQ